MRPHSSTLGNFVNLSYLKVLTFLHQIKKVCNLATRLLPCGSSLYTLAIGTLMLFHKFSKSGMLEFLNT